MITQVVVTSTTIRSPPRQPLNMSREVYPFPVTWLYILLHFKFDFS